MMNRYLKTISKELRRKYFLSERDAAEATKKQELKSRLLFINFDLYMKVFK